MELLLSSFQRIEKAMKLHSFRYSMSAVQFLKSKSVLVPKKNLCWYKMFFFAAVRYFSVWRSLSVATLDSFYTLYFVFVFVLCIGTIFFATVWYFSVWKSLLVATLDSFPKPYCRNFPASKGFLINLAAKYFTQTFQEMSQSYVNGFAATIVQLSQIYSA